MQRVVRWSKREKSVEACADGSVREKWKACGDEKRKITSFKDNEDNSDKGD